jgi:phosphoglycolate phosphatase-like HAD superfamily hydrolase
MNSTLLVFDVDGTLITTRAGRKAFNRALHRFFGLEDAAGSIPMAGRTDPLIFREICERHGLDPGVFDAWKREFLANLAEELDRDPGFVHPGVAELLDACSGRPEVALALGTGNVEEGARLKLARHDLNRFFPTGGFGADGETRDEVIARAVERARSLYERSFDQVVVIGDTPLDIQCGKANACLTVGVATGHHSEAELVECGADLVLPSFENALTVFFRLCNL